MTVYGNGTKSKPGVSSGYGPRSGGAFSFHYGCDMIGYSQLRAILGGKVTHAGWMNSDAGNAIAIDSRDPLTGKTVTIVRMHAAAVSVRVGQTVNEGDVIGTMGKTGNASGNCDHVEIRYWSGGSYTTENPESWFAARVGGGSPAGGPIAADQRRTVAVVNGRTQASSQSATTGDPLQPGTVGNFVGWIRGESVEGNNVWFKGTSGRWFWSGGFEGGANTAGLADLNAPAVGAQQRKVVAHAAANGRTDATTAAPVAQSLPAGTVGDFSSWKNGEAVEGNSVWFKGAHAGNWFWSGAFEGGANTANLANENPVTPPPATSNKRTTRFDANGRTGPTTKFPVAQSLPAGTEGEFSHWAKGENVRVGDFSSDVWFRGAIAGNWFAAANFTSLSTDGLALESNPPTEPTTPAPGPQSKNNPRGLKVLTPALPMAQLGLRAPLGYKDDAFTQPTLRTTAGSDQHAVQPIIDRFIFHYTGNTEDNQDWFSYKNSRTSCPHAYIRGEAIDGVQVTEFIRPSLKGATTGPDWNWRSYTTENQGVMIGGVLGVSDSQIRINAEVIAHLASLDGKTWDGIPVSFKIDRTHVIGHREALPGSTTCPGDYFMGKVDEMIALAKSIYAEKYAPKPEPEPEPTDVFLVPAELGRRILADVTLAFTEQ